MNPPTSLPTEPPPLDSTVHLPSLSGPIAALEAIIRQPERVCDQLRQGGAAGLTASMLLLTLIGALGYGFVVGTFSGGVQLWAGPVKVAGGLFLSAFICLPSLYLFAGLSGSRAGLGEIAGLVAGLLLLLTALLIGFAPVAWVFSQSTESVVAMGALHLVFWFVGTAFAVRFLMAAFARRDARSPDALRIWVGVFVLVMLQMTTALRPLVGTADTFLPVEKRFFVAHWLDCMKRPAQAGPTNPEGLR